MPVEPGLQLRGTRPNRKRAPCNCVFKREISPVYIWRSVIVESDHKALETILVKLLVSAPKRFQRMIFEAATS